MRKLALFGMLVAATGAANAAVLFSEDFESYAEWDNAAMVSGQWDGNTYPATSGPTDDIAAHSGSMCFKSTTGDVGIAYASFTPFTPSTSEQLRFTFWYRPNASGSPSREGITMGGTDTGIWTGAKSRQIAFSNYSTTNDNYYTRCVGSGADNQWVKTDIAKSVAWHKMVIEVGTTSNANKARFFVDDVLAADRPINAGVWNCFKMGNSATDTATASGTVYFDDILVETVTGVPVTMSGLWID